MPCCRDTRRTKADREKTGSLSATICGPYLSIIGRLESDLSFVLIEDHALSESLSHRRIKKA